MTEGSSVVRAAAVGTIVGVALLVAYLIATGTDGSRTYKLTQQTAGQLVTGNQVLVAGQPVGSVEEIELTDDGQARITISTDIALHQGTTAVVRATSLSGIANRYVSLTPGPDSEPELEDGSVIGAEATRSPVDLDQLFDTFDDRTRRALQEVIKGSADLYRGRGPEANRTYRYFAPGLYAARKLFEELNRDQQVLTQFLVDSSRVVTGLAERRDDLVAMVSNSNEALGAIADQNEELDRTLRALPGALRQGSSTFAELRPALDDLDPLVATSKRTTRDLAPFLRRLRPVARRSVPIFYNLGRAVHRRGRANDLGDFSAQLVRLQRRSASAFPNAIRALSDSQPVIAFARPYMPDVLALLSKLGTAAGYYDANGHYLRAMPAGANLFTYNQVTGELDPNPSAQQYDAFDFGLFRRCPGAATQPASDGSSPFLDEGNLTIADCNPTQVPPGP